MPKKGGPGTRKSVRAEEKAALAQGAKNQPQVPGLRGLQPAGGADQGGERERHRQAGREAQVKQGVKADRENH